MSVSGFFISLWKAEGQVDMYGRERRLDSSDNSPLRELLTRLWRLFGDPNASWMSHHFSTLPHWDQTSSCKQTRLNHSAVKTWTHDSASDFCHELILGSEKEIIWMKLLLWSLSAWKLQSMHLKGMFFCLFFGMGGPEMIVHLVEKCKAQKIVLDAKSNCLSGFAVVLGKLESLKVRRKLS